MAVVMRILKVAWRTDIFLIIAAVWLLALAPRWMPPLEGQAFPASRVHDVRVIDDADGAILTGRLEKRYDHCTPLGPVFWHQFGDEPWILVDGVTLLRAPVGRKKGSWPWGPYRLPMRADEIGQLEVQFMHRCSYRVPFTGLRIWNPFWDRKTTILTLNNRELIASM